MNLLYGELPPEAPTPRLWKSLGHLCPGIEMHYAVETFHGDLCIDREADLRDELMHVGQALEKGGMLNDGVVFARDDQKKGQKKGQTLVRFVACSCGSNLYTTRN